VLEPRHPSDVLRMIRVFEKDLIAVEDIVGGALRVVRVSGVGIVVSALSDRLRLKLSRRYEKVGKVVFFNDIAVEDLDEFRDQVLFLVTDVKITSTEESLTLNPFEKIGVLHIEYTKQPTRLKERFKPWRVYRGEIRIGKKAFFINRLIRVPTYRKRSILFLCHPNDLKRYEGEG